MLTIINVGLVLPAHGSYRTLYVHGVIAHWCNGVVTAQCTHRCMQQKGVKCTLGGCVSGGPGSHIKAFLASLYSCKEGYIIYADII